MSKKKTHLEFVQDLQDRCPDCLKLYEIVDEYKGATISIHIKNQFGICKIRPVNLWNCKSPTIKTSTNKLQYFKMMLREKFPNYIFNYIVVGPYVGMKEKITVMTKYGLCGVVAYDLLRGILPTMGAALDKNEFFKKKANEKFNNFYKYNNIVYGNSYTKLSITCPIHGDFEKGASAHLMGEGCQECARQLVGFKNWKKCCKVDVNVATFYSLRCWGNGENFYKIGITKNSIKRRYSDTTAMPYNYEIVQTISGTCEDVWNFEVYMKRELRKLGLHYTPKIHFDGGVTECFTINYLKH